MFFSVFFMTRFSKEFASKLVTLTVVGLIGIGLLAACDGSGGAGNASGRVPQAGVDVGGSLPIEQAGLPNVEAISALLVDVPEPTRLALQEYWKEYSLIFRALPSLKIDGVVQEGLLAIKGRIPFDSLERVIIYNPLTRDVYTFFEAPEPLSEVHPGMLMKTSMSQAGLSSTTVESVVPSTLSWTDSLTGKVLTYGGMKIPYLGMNINDYILTKGLTDFQAGDLYMNVCKRAISLLIEKGIYFNDAIRRIF
jgi:hypothetical protein